MKLQGILFDFDGTLGNTTDLILASFKNTIAHYNQKQPSKLEIVSTFGLPLRDGLAKFLPGVPIDEAAAFYRDHNYGNHDKMIKPFPYVEDGLKDLKEHGYKLCVVTSKKTPLAERGLNLLHLRQYMDGVITFDVCREYKPAPEPMLKGAAALGLAPQACLCVGDSPFDLLSGKAAGCTTALVNWTPYTLAMVHKLVIPDYTIDKLTDLVTMLDQINKEKK